MAELQSAVLKDRAKRRWKNADGRVGP